LKNLVSVHPWLLATLFTISLWGCGPDRDRDDDGGDDSSETDDDDNQTGSSLTVGELPDEFADVFPSSFTQYSSVFGVHVFATSETPQDKVLHAVHVLAEYLDNDEDGEADNPAVIEQMTGGSEPAAMVLAASEDELEESGLFDSDVLDILGPQDLYGEEIHPEGSSQTEGFDATLEEVLHLVTARGYSRLYPDELGEQSGSTLTNAMDLARGGHFESVPSSYPDDAWYHYDDTTCDYRCMATEYFYWALTSMLGAQDYPGRCEDIAIEWEPCTPALVESMDPAVFALLSDPTWSLPTVLPDGSYSP